MSSRRFRLLIVVLAIFLLASLCSFIWREIETTRLWSPSVPAEIGPAGWCQKWAVVAPIDSEWASEAVRRQVRMQDWCLVIVFKRKPSKTYDTRWFDGEGNKAVVSLTPDNVKVLGNSDERT